MATTSRTSARRQQPQGHPISHSLPNPPADGAFEGHLRTTVARLRAAVAEVLAAVGANMRVPHSITRDFGLDKSLVSKLARVVREPDPFTAALDVPGEEAMRIFSRSMREAGAPPRSLEMLQESVDSFQDMVRTHCGDRATLEMLAASSSASSSGRSDKQRLQLETFRKNMFRGASAVFGVQARAQVSADFLTPSRGNPESYDVTLINGLVELRRIRPDVTWAVSSMRTIDKEGRPGPLVPVEPIDAEIGASVGRAPVIREFSSAPIPELQITDTNDSIRKFELPEGPVGSTSATTIYTGWTYRNASPTYRIDGDVIREHFVSLNTPSELVVHDLFIHKDFGFARKPTANLYSQLPGGVCYPHGPRDRGLLQLTEPLLDLSGEPVHPATADVPNYARLVDYVLGQLGHTVKDFYGVRVLMRYPPIPSMLLYRYELPER